MKPMEVLQMHDEDEILSGSLELLVDYRARENAQQAEIADRAENARKLADEARLALADLASPAVAIIALRLAGAEIDWDGRAVNKDREDTAWEVLSRIGIPRLRATAIAASISAQTQIVAPGSPGWVAPELDEDANEIKEIDPTSVDAQIQAFLDGARAQRDLGKTD